MASYLLLLPALRSLLIKVRHFLVSHFTLLLAISFLSIHSPAKAACPVQKLFSIHKIKEQGTEISMDQSTDEHAVKMEIPLSLAIGTDKMTLTGSAVQTIARIPIRKRLWRFTSRATRLTTGNLQISYEFGDTGKLTSARDPSSKIGVSIVNRKIDVKNQRKYTQFDAYVDLIIDYSNARLAGTYQGSVTITVNCTMK